MRSAMRSMVCETWRYSFAFLLIIDNMIIDYRQVLSVGCSSASGRALGSAEGESPMSLVADLKSLEPSQRSAIWASYLGWTLDAFDYFLMVFMFKAISAEVGAAIGPVSKVICLTLAARPLGAFVFGLLADRFGRRPILMIDILLFSVLEFASGFAPTLFSLLVLRFLFGIAMGGEWGIGSGLGLGGNPPR